MFYGLDSQTELVSMGIMIVFNTDYKITCNTKTLTLRRSIVELQRDDYLTAKLLCSVCLTINTLLFQA